MEKPLVQILVVVVITKLRTLWTEVENGFGWRAFRSEWVDPKRFVKYDKKWEGLAGFRVCEALIELKGKMVKIPLLGERKGREEGGLALFFFSSFSQGFRVFWDKMYLRWRKRTLRLERKEGVELSSLFKRKEGNSLGKGEKKSQRIWAFGFGTFGFFFLFAFSKSLHVAFRCYVWKNP